MASDMVVRGSRCLCADGAPAAGLGGLCEAHHGLHLTPMGVQNQLGAFPWHRNGAACRLVWHHGPIRGAVLMRIDDAAVCKWHGTEDAAAAPSHFPSPVSQINQELP